jgi:hypothetical protein
MAFHNRYGRERAAKKWKPVFRVKRAQTFEFRARFNDQAAPDRIVLQERIVLSGPA